MRKRRGLCQVSGDVRAARAWAHKGCDLSAPRVLPAGSSEPHRGRSYLHYASERGNVPLVQVLLEADADANAVDDDGRTPMHVAHSEDIIGLMLEYRGNLNMKDASGLRPLEALQQRVRAQKT